MTEGLDPEVVLEHVRCSRIAVDTALEANLGDGDLKDLDLDGEITRLQERVARLNGAGVASSVLARAVHETTHQLHDAGRTLHALGAGAPYQRGTLVQVSSSKGGVPKTALPSATIGRGGVDGDRQGDRMHHGRPLQAVCLWSQDVIDALRAEGHPVYAGAAGENLTVSGVDWSTIRPGVQVSVGDAMLEISAFATPCAKNAPWFRDGKFRRMDHGLHPGWSRAYAWVIDGGTVAPGAAVVVEP
jgi:MOSC domain-containing protein YiiM